MMFAGVSLVLQKLSGGGGGGGTQHHLHLLFCKSVWIIHRRTQLKTNEFYCTFVEIVNIWRFKLLNT